MRGLFYVGNQVRRGLCLPRSRENGLLATVFARHEFNIFIRHQRFHHLPAIGVGFQRDLRTRQRGGSFDQSVHLVRPQQGGVPPPKYNVSGLRELLESSRSSAVTYSSGTPRVPGAE